MTRLTKTSLFAVLGLTVAFAGATDALACGRGGGGYRGGYGGYRGNYGGYGRYVQPVYRPAIGRPPVVQQPVTPVAQQPPFGQPGPVQPQAIQPQGLPQQPIQPQAVQPQAVQQQAVQTAQSQQAPANTAPATSAPVTTAPATATQPQDAGQTALDLLSNFGGVETTPVDSPAPQPQAFNGVGNWSATLSNGATVQLDMRNDGSFTWTANKSGKQSTFSGTFSLNGQSLTLTRSDSQKLSGNLLSPNANGFTFKLDGVKDNGLQFSRS